MKNMAFLLANRNVDISPLKFLIEVLKVADMFNNVYCPSLSFETLVINTQEQEKIS